MLTSSFVNRIISTSAKSSSTSTTCKFFIRHTSRLQQSQGEPTFTFKNIANLQNRLRPGKIKSKKKLIPGKDSWSVVGYATANEYNLVALVEKFIEDGNYNPIDLSDDLDGECLLVQAKNVEVDDHSTEFVPPEEISSKDIFIFNNGSVVFWNIPQLERQKMMEDFHNFETDPFEEDDIAEEKEAMLFGISDTGKTHFKSGEIKLNPNTHSESEDFNQQRLEKYAFSNAIAASVKLGMLESKLDRIVDSIEVLADDLRNFGEIKMDEKQVLMKTGEIFSLRNEVNLSSDLLDTPDFYWDRDDLERLYLDTCSNLKIKKRTSVMNERLNNCIELMSMVTDFLNHKHSSRLEWYIIILIMIEIGFEAGHFIQYLY